MTTHGTQVSGASAAEFGVVPEHWDIFLQAAARTGCAILLRSGKSASVPWIRRGYPAKPLLFKAKVDRDLGLLVVRKEEERVAMLAHPVCKLVPLPSPGQLLAAFNTPNFDSRARFIEALARGQGRQVLSDDRQGDDRGLDRAADPREGQLPALVVERSSNLPYTSDYDLAAVIDTQNAHYETTFASVGPMQANSSLSNWTIDALSRHLNQQFGSERIQHGTEAQYSGQAANKEPEMLVLFRPDGRAESIPSGPATESWRLLRDLMVEYHPDLEHSFNN